VFQNTKTRIKGDELMVLLPYPFRGGGAQRNSTEIQQSGHNQRWKK